MRLAIVQMVENVGMLQRSAWGSAALNQPSLTIPGGASANRAVQGPGGYPPQALSLRFERASSGQGQRGRNDLKVTAGCSGAQIGCKPRQAIGPAPLGDATSDPDHDESLEREPVAVVHVLVVRFLRHAGQAPVVGACPPVNLSASRK